ncbi:PepSY domain-containing protein [Roseococcus sp. YIM B11640]|uniref:PepSY domain-containing protein n=1 Tax=Roseococcus sp. YIM B11640 TaxID=3133973 RepID=UPI003C7CCFE2
MRRRFIPVLASVAALLASPVAAQDRRDHERARAALEAGQIRPLSELLSEVERRFRGRVIEAELEFDDGQWLYEIKILPPNGRVFNIELDAASGTLIRSRGPVQERSAGEIQNNRGTAR